MNFGNFGFTEILLISVVVLLLFGARRIPEVAAGLGKGIREFKKNLTDVDRQIREPERTPAPERLASPEPAQRTAAEDPASEPKRLLN